MTLFQRQQLALHARRMLLLVITILAAGALVHDLQAYGRWAFARLAAAPQQQLRQVAGPTSPWLPGVLAATPESASILMVADELADPDWLTAYYLYPRAVHVISSRALRDRAGGPPLPEAGFLLRDGHLLTWPELKPVPEDVNHSPVLPPERPSGRGVMALLLTTAAALGWGGWLLLLIAPGLLLTVHGTGRTGLALLSGLGGMGMVGFMAAFAGATASWWLTLSMTLGGLAALWPARRWFRRGESRPSRGQTGASRLVPYLVAGLIAILFAAGMMRAMGEPMHHWDERFQWAYKAKILLHEGGINGPSFQDLDRPHLHRRYPLALPALEAQLARLAGGFSQERAVKGLFPVFFLGLVLTVHGALRQRLGSGPAALLTALLAALPPLHLATRIQGGPIHTGFADLPLAALAAALALCLVPGTGASGGKASPAWVAGALFAGLAFAVKPEGVVFLVAALLVAAATILRPGSRPGWRRGSAAAVLLTLLILPVVALHVAVPTVGTVGYSGDENYLARLAPQALASGVRNNLPEALAAMATAPFTGRWAFYGVLPLAALLTALALRLRPTGSHLLALLIALPLAADLLAFTVTGSNIRWHLGVALDRLLLQVAPLVIILTGGLMARLESRHRA